MKSSWQKACCGMLCALAAANIAAGQDSYAPMQSQVWRTMTAQPSYAENAGGEVQQPEDLIGDIDVEQAAWLQPPGQPSLATGQPTAQPSARSARATQFGNIRLASAPNMFGDLPMSTATIVDINTAGGAQVFRSTFSLPLTTASRVGKIAENDSPIPRDRVFFNYNHFQNVFQLSETPLFPPAPTIIRQQPIDRYTLGAEKTFFDGWTSVELRMPMQGIPDTQLQSIGFAAGNWGNLTAVLKSLLYINDAIAVGAGMSIETPTGSSTFTRIGTTTLQFTNQSTHLAPYIGFVWSPGDPRWGWGNGLFLTGFAQIDIATSSSAVNVLGPGAIPTGPPIGKFTDQNLGFLDLGGGYWLYRNPDAPRWTGLAVIGEFHYTTSLQDADQIAGALNGAAFVLNNTDRRFDVVNGTIGVQALMFDASSLRVAGVFPLGNENRRLFDSEVQVQFNRRF